jgi:hypothetical protein
LADTVDAGRTAALHHRLVRVGLARCRGGAPRRHRPPRPTDPTTTIEEENTMTVTITGRLTDSMGVSRHEDVTSAIAPGGHLVASCQTRFVSLPADSYLDRQPSRIPLDLHHRDVVGEVVFIERRENGLYLVATSDEDALADLDIEMFFSPSVNYRIRSKGGCAEHGTDAELDGVAITTSPATYCQTPITVVPAGLHRAADHARCRRELRGCADIIERAHKYDQRRSRNAPHTIATWPPPKPVAVPRMTAAPVSAAPSFWPAGMRFSGAGEILAIR